MLDGWKVGWKGKAFCPLRLHSSARASSSATPEKGVGGEEGEKQTIQEQNGLATTDEKQGRICNTVLLVILSKSLEVAAPQFLHL